MGLAYLHTFIGVVEVGVNVGIHASPISRVWEMATGAKLGNH